MTPSPKQKAQELAEKCAEALWPNYGSVMTSAKETILRELSLEKLVEADEMLEWLSQCTAGEWEELNNARLATSRNNFRTAIRQAMQSTKEEKE